jgi:hypothetical protein
MCLVDLETDLLDASKCSQLPSLACSTLSLFDGVIALTILDLKKKQNKKT